MTTDTHRPTDPYRFCTCGSTTTVAAAHHPIGGSIVTCAATGYEIYAAGGSKPASDPSGFTHLPTAAP